MLNSLMLSLVWVILCGALAPFFPFPHSSANPYIVLSVVVHLFYFALLSYSYRHGDFSRVYPIVRGVPPLLVAMVSIFILFEPISSTGLLGIMAICIGILSLEFGQKLPKRFVFLLSLLTAITVAMYTVIDGLGARVSGNSTSYLIWLSLLQSIFYSGIVVGLKGGRPCLSHIRRYWKTGLLTGSISLSTYGVVLWTMTQAPIAYVSALRETSVLFASIIAVVWLKETFNIYRLLSSAIILIGIIFIKLG